MHQLLDERHGKWQEKYREGRNDGSWDVCFPVGKSATFITVTNPTTVSQPGNRYLYTFSSTDTHTRTVTFENRGFQENESWEDWAAVLLFFSMLMESRRCERWFVADLISGFGFHIRWWWCSGSWCNRNWMRKKVLEILISAPSKKVVGRVMYACKCRVIQ